MKHNKMQEVKDKVSGTLHETTGRVINNKGMEYKGKLLKGRGKARELAGNVTDEMEIVKDKVVDGVKDASKFTADEIKQLKKKLSKTKDKNRTTNAIFIGIGVIAGLYILKTIINSDER